MKITRVVGSPDGKYQEPGYMIERGAEPDTLIVQEGSSPVSFGGGVLKQVEWQLTPKDIIRYSIEGKAKVVTRRTVDGERTFVENAKDTCIGSAYEARLELWARPGDRILGLGQHEDGVADYRDCTQHLYQNNMQIPMPVFLTTGNVAVLVDANCLMVYEEREGKIVLTLDAVSQIDYYVIEGENPARLIKGLRYLTGKAPLLPLWAYGYVQSRERYRTQEEILLTAREFEKRQIPVSCLVQDWITWEKDKWGNKRLDRERYPNLRGLTGELHEKGIALMMSVWPNMNKGCEDNQEMLEAGKLYANLSTYDAFDEEAREIYWRQCERELFSGGTDAWWCDSTEPFTPDWNGSEKKSAQERYEIAKESLTKYMDARDANAFALWHAKGMHDNQRKSDTAKRVINLTRSGYPSIQKYGAVLWSGDIMATWDVLRRQIVEGLQMSASGIPYWTLDIGAFFTGNLNAWKRWSGAAEGTQPWFWNGDFEDGVADKGYCELYVRWLQYGAFLPMMRSHGTDTPREPWNFGEPGSVYYDTILKYIRLRYRLVPYLYSLAYQVYAEDALMMRPLAFDYPQDERAAGIMDEYRFGDFLVCPVTFPVEYAAGGVRVDRKPVREVYLPEGDDWFDYESGAWYPGGTWMEAAAPVEKMPLYVRSGAILPVNPAGAANLYEAQRPGEAALEIYGGADGSFLYYLDSGNGYEYQNGKYAAIRLVWEEASRELRIHGAEGEYPHPAVFHITLLDRSGSRLERKINYDGTQIRVSFL